VRVIVEVDGLWHQRRAIDERRDRKLTRFESDKMRRRLNPLQVQANPSRLEVSWRRGRDSRCCLNSGGGTSSLMLEDWIELCKLFTSRGVEFLLVGGQAVIAHGYPRLTKDMDLWVRPTAKNGALVLQALSDFKTWLMRKP